MSTDRILLIMPTRGRPWGALEAIASVMKNAADPARVKILVCTDEDDYERFHIDRPSRNVSAVCAPRARFIQWMNDAAHEWKGSCEWIGWLADDVRFLTPGWDSLVRDHKELVVYGQDGYHDEKMATHPFIRTEIPRALGYLLPSELIHGCADTFIEALARELNSIAYDPRIKTEHLHPAAGKSADDHTYRDAMEHWEKDKATFETVIRPRIPELAKTVFEYIHRAT